MEVFYDVLMIVLPFLVMLAAAHLLFAAVCRRVADDKGYPGRKWFRWGILFGFLALIEIIQKPNLAVSSKEKNIIDVLREYKQLLDSGAITPEEFERKKAELLKYNTPTYYPPQYNNAANNGKKWVCPECGNVNPPGVWVCESCGREK